MHKTLWTFGCSHTQGHGLSDCVGADGFSPIPGVSELAWPVTLSKLMNIPLINNSHAGIGPKAVWNNIINSQIQPDDVIVIMWPCWETRIDILLNPTEDCHHPCQIYDLRAWNPRDAGYFESYYQPYDRWIEWHTLARHVTDNFSNNNKLINTLYNEYESIFPVPPLVAVDFTQTYFAAQKYCDMPRALDGSHNGELAHKTFAEDLYSEVMK